MVTKSKSHQANRTPKQSTRPVRDILLELTRQMHATRVIQVLPAQPPSNQN